MDWRTTGPVQMVHMQHQLTSQAASLAQQDINAPTLLRHQWHVKTGPTVVEVQPTVSSVLQDIGE